MSTNPPAPDEPAFTLQFLEATYLAGYEHGVRDGRRLADDEAAHNFEAAACAVKAMVDAPSLTPEFLTGTSAELTAAAVQRIETKRSEVRAQNAARRRRDGAA